MKKAIYVLAVLTVVLVGCNQKKEEKKVARTIPEGEVVQIAVVNIDSVLANYDFAVQANDELMDKQENARLDLNQKARALQNDMATFQNKMDNNAFLSRQRAENEYNRLQQRQAELQQHEQQLSEQLMEEQQRMSKQMRDSIDNVIKELNKEHQFRLIITTSSLNDNVLYSDEELDITEVVVDMLNERWNNGKKK